MSTRWNNFVKDYLTFSAKERLGVIIVLCLIVIAYLVSRFYPVHQKSISKDAFANELAQLKITIDSSHKSSPYYNNENNSNDYYKPKDYDKSVAKGELFAFDPNTLDAEGWKKLGLKDKTVTTIQNFLAKGFRFKQPDDLKRIYGLNPQLAERLIPYVNIAGGSTIATTAAASSSSSSTSVHTYANSSNTYSEPKAVKVIDVNLADTTAYISLPGIGSKLAARIVGFREKLGGFYSVNQVGETYGVPDSTFQKIKSRLLCNNPSVKKININTADVNALKAHPYIRWNIANAIISYRTQHGNFSSVQDLLKIDIITKEVFEKAFPYLTI